MQNHTILAAASALVLLTGLGTAQTKGQSPPPFEFQKTWNGAPENFGGLDGKLVILDFSQTW